MARCDRNHIVILDYSNFNCVVSQNEFVAVLFYQPYYHIPLETFEEISYPIPLDIYEEYDSAAATLHKEKIPVILAKLDVTKQKNRYSLICYKIGIVPKIKVFRGNKVEDYNGPHDAQGIVECFKRLSFTFPAQIKSAEERIGYKDKIVIVGVFPNFSGQDYDNFMAAAELLKWNYDICLTEHLHSGDPSVSAPAVSMFVPPCSGFFDNPHTDFFDIQTFNVEALVEFVTDHSTPLVFHYNTSTFIYKKYLLDTENEKVMLYINFEDKDAHTLKSTYLDVAKKYRGQGLIFMLGDLEDSKRLCWFFGHTSSKYPLIVIKNYKKEIYAKLILMPEQLETWVEDYKAGKVAPSGLSEPIPVQNAAGHVQVVVARTFRDMVMAGDKNVLLELYRPEFKNCAEVAAVLDEVAEYFKDEKRDDVVIAKLDESANDIRSEYIDDLTTVGDSPTLYLIPASGLMIMRYDVDIITKDDVIMFIEECGYNPKKEQKTK